MKGSPSTAAEMRLVGGRLCLDFVNTVDGRKRDSSLKKSRPPNTLVLGDKLGNYFDLAQWSRHAGILTTAEAGRLMKEAKRKPTEAERVFDRAIELREALYRIFKSTVTDGVQRSLDLETVNDELHRAGSHERLTRSGNRFTWEWVGSGPALDRMLWSIAYSGAEFLTTGDLSRLRECGGEDCGWLFEDTSKNRSRQWCHMQDCGNLAKVRRFRTRLRLGNKDKDD